MPTIALAVVLAYLFGYAFTMVPLLRAGLAFGSVLTLALVADTVSILIMEVIDNANYARDPRRNGGRAVALSFGQALPLPYWSPVPSLTR